VVAELISIRKLIINAVWDTQRKDLVILSPQNKCFDGISRPAPKFHEYSSTEQKILSNSNSYMQIVTIEQMTAWEKSVHGRRIDTARSPASLL